MRGADEDRTEIVERLDRTVRVAGTLYGVLLVFVLGAILGVVVFAIGRRDSVSNTQGEWYYFGAAVVIVAAILLSRLGWLARRARRPRRILTVRSAPVDTGPGSGRVWQISLGGADDHATRADDEDFRHDDGGLYSREDDQPGAVTFSRGLSVPLARLPLDLLPDEAALARIEGELARGLDLDRACRAVQPEYGGWNRLERRAYRLYLAHLLDERRRAAE